MSLEEALKANTAALEANTKALNAKAGSATAPAAAKETKTAPAAEKKAGEHSRDEMIAALTKVKDKKGGPIAKGVIKDAGGVDKMADIPDSKIDAVFDAATAALAEEGDGL